MTLILLALLTLKMDERSIKNLEGVNPELRNIVIETYFTCDEDFIIIDGIRTQEEQEKHLKAGASTTLNSKHLTGNAVDFVLKSFDWEDIEGFKRVGECFKDFKGITYGGDWNTFKDYGHIELQ